MKIKDVKKTIDKNHGYLVHFEHCGDGMLTSDYFPDVKSGEDPFDTYDEAVEIGVDFADATKGETCNFYLVRADNFKPLQGWDLKNR